MSEMRHARLLTWVGHRADDVYGARVGRVEAILVDREQGTPTWLLIRLPQRHGFIAAPLHDLLAGAGHLHLPQSRAQLLQGPRVPESGRLTARQERLLCELLAVRRPTRGATLSEWERRSASARLVEPGLWEPAPRGASVDRLEPSAPSAAVLARAVPEALISTAALSPRPAAPIGDALDGPVTVRAAAPVPVRMAFRPALGAQRPPRR